MVRLIDADVLMPGAKYKGRYDVVTAYDIANAPTIDPVKHGRWVIGYKGCRNCSHQIAPLRGCEWLERGGDGVIHLICPKWERRMNEKV